MYAALGRRLFEAKDTPEAVNVIAELKQKLRDRIPLFDEFRALFPGVVFTDNITKQKKLVKYTLVGLADHVSSASVVDYGQMTIEHLAPQSLIGTAGFTEGVVGQLGNLLLVSEELNVKLKDRPFKDKKKILKEAGFPLPGEIESAVEWGAKEIVARTELLALRAFNEIWKI